jgi:hypothetical protein
VEGKARSLWRRIDAGFARAGAFLKTADKVASASAKYATSLTVAWEMPKARFSHP